MSRVFPHRERLHATYRTVWQELTNFWDRLFVLYDNGLLWLTRSVRRSGNRAALPLLVETLEPRWLLSTYSVLHGATLTESSSTGLLAGLGSGLSITSHTDPTNGYAAVYSDGSFIYSPSTGFAGTDSFTFTFTNGVTSTTDPAYIDVYDHAPVALNHSYTVGYGQTLMVNAPGLLAGATDADGDSLTVVSTTYAPNGYVSLEGGGSFYYTPNYEFYGTDSFTYTISDGALTASANATIDVSAVTVTNPGTQSNAEGDTVSLAISASDQTSGATLNYFATGLPTGLSINRTTGVISGTVGGGGTYQTTVTASDGTAANSQTFTWNISSPISITNPGTQTSTEGGSVSFAISATDSDTGTLTYSALQTPPGVTINPSTGVLSGTVAIGDGQVGTYPTSVTVSDGTHSNNITFSWAVHSPISFTNPGQQNNTENDSVTLTISATDSTSATVTYTADGLPPGLAIDPSSGVISGTVAVGDGQVGTYPTTVTASDDTYTASLDFNWYVDNARVTIAAPSDQTNNESDTVSLSISATDFAGGTLTYSAIGLPDGLRINPATGDVTGTIATGDSVNEFYYPIVTASDDTYSATTGFNWTINSPITITSPSNQTKAESDTVSLSISASDARSLSLSYGAIDLPKGLTINPSSGTITGTIAAGAAAYGPYTTTVTATDGTDFGSATFTWTVSSYVTLTDPDNQTSIAGSGVSLTLAASDAGADTFSFAAVNLPAGLSLNTSTGVISGDASIGAIAQSPYLTTVTATDGSYSTSQTFWWTVNSPVTITSPNSSQHNNTGDSVSLAIDATDSTSATLTYSATGLPIGLSDDTATGVISGTITAGGVYQTILTASDDTYSASQFIRWTVTSDGPLVLFNPGSQWDWTGDLVSLPMSATDANGSATVSYSVTGLPSGLSLNTSTGLISGNISAGDDASSPYIVVVTASDGTYTDKQAFTWLVNNSGPITLLNPGDQSNADSSPISLTLSGSDTVSGATLTYSATNLPTGLSLNTSTGVISGTLSAGGWYAVEVTLSDDTNSVSQGFLWNVTSTGAVTLTNPGDQFNDESDSVTLTLQGSDTISGHSLSYSETGLPGGLSVNSSTGVISGTVSAGDAASGPYTVTVTAGDGTYSNSQTFTWHIGTPVILLNPGNQTGHEGDTVQLPVPSLDLNGGNVTYTVSGLPGGLSFNTSTDVITGTLSSGDHTDSPYTITVAANDGTASASITFNWTVNGAGSLTLTNPGTQTNYEGATLSLTLTDSYSGGGSVSFSSMGLPWGLTLNPSSGVISGTLGTWTVGDSSYTATVIATDGTSSDTQTFTWVVNDPVTLTAPSNETTSLGGSVSVTLTATDSTSATLTYAEVGLPSGLSLNASTGVITGSVAGGVPGTWEVLVTDSDGTYSDAEWITWTITSPLTLTRPSDQSNTEGNSVSLQLSASEGGSSVGLTYSAVGLPTGLSLNTNTGLITGTVAAGDDALGPYLTAVTVTDSSGDSLLKMFLWTVNSPITLTNPGFESNVAGDSVSLQISAIDSTSAPLTYSATGLPLGLSINTATGLITGTVKAVTTSGSAFITIITASDASYSATQTFVWLVANQAPTPTPWVGEIISTAVRVGEAKDTTPVVFLVHGVRDEGKWYDDFEAALQAEWEKTGAKKQNVVGFHYQGIAKETMLDLDKWADAKLDTKALEELHDFIFKKQTTLLAATTHLDHPTKGVKRAAEDLATELKAYHKAHPDAPINLFAHSNGTMVVLLALQQIQDPKDPVLKNFKVNNVVLAASPYDTTYAANDTALKAIAKDRAKRIDFHFSEWDIVTANKIVHGGDAITEAADSKNIGNHKWSDQDIGWKAPSGIMYRTVHAHSAFADPKDSVFKKWFLEVYAKELSGK